MSDVYYCYSKKLCLFLRSMNESYIASDTNKKSNTKYWVFNKCKRLDSLIAVWNEIKHKY